MGTFTLTRDGYRPEQLQRLHERHVENGFHELDRHRHGDWNLRFYARADRHNSFFVRLGDDDFIGITGTFIYRDETGKEAAARFHSEFDAHTPPWKHVLGNYAIVLKKFGKLFVFTDALGANKIYRSSDGQVFSNSFISVLDLIPQASADPIGCHQYVWLRLIYGDRTFVSEIQPIPPNSLLRIDDKVHIEALAFPGSRQLADWDLDLEESADFFAARLRDLFKVYAANFGNRINCSLSGGYDSRLVLAALLDAGVTPELYVYGRPKDADVVIAKQLAQTIGVPITTVDKSELPPPDIESVAQQLDARCFAFDGWSNPGIVSTSGSDFETRIARTEGDRVVMLGTAGEVFRNFFYLPDRPYSLRKFASAIYYRLDPAACGDSFSPQAYVDALVTDIQKVLDTDQDRLDRRQIELIYPLFRARYMFGRDMVINQRFGWAASPFLEPSIFADAHNLPIGFKNMGRLEARMIRRLNMELAACPSDYGHSFAEDPPLSKTVKQMLFDYHRPLALRRYSYRLQNRKPQPRDLQLRQDFLERIIDTEFPFTRGLFNIDRVNDAGAFDRITTIEYVLQRANH